MLLRTFETRKLRVDLTGEGKGIRKKHRKETTKYVERGVQRARDQP